MDNYFSNEAIKCFSKLGIMSVYSSAAIQALTRLLFAFGRSIKTTSEWRTIVFISEFQHLQNGAKLCHVQNYNICYLHVT